MAKWVNDLVLDGAWEVLDGANIMTACSQQPADRTEAVTTYALADATMTPVTDFTKADGDGGGRKVTVAAKATIDVDTTGDATHIALCDATNLLYVTTCTSQTLTQGNTVDFPAWKAEIDDPA